MKPPPRIHKKTQFLDVCHTPSRPRKLRPPPSRVQTEEVSEAPTEHVTPNIPASFRPRVLLPMEWRDWCSLNDLVVVPDHTSLAIFSCIVSKGIVAMPIYFCVSLVHTEGKWSFTESKLVYHAWGSGSLDKVIQEIVEASKASHPKAVLCIRKRKRLAKCNSELISLLTVVADNCAQSSIWKVSSMPMAGSLVGLQWAFLPAKYWDDEFGFVFNKQPPRNK